MITALIVTYVVLGMTTVKILDNDVGIDFFIAQVCLHNEKMSELPWWYLNFVMILAIIVAWPKFLKENSDGYW